MEFTTQYFSFNKKDKTLQSDLGTLGVKTYPHEFTVRSEHTGKVVKFYYDEISAEQNEWWDGEMAAYLPMGDVPNCERLIITAVDWGF